MDMRTPREAVVTTSAILGFFGTYRPFSNFHIERVRYQEVLYPSNENAFQAAKVAPSKRSQFLNISPGKAKQLGGVVKIDSKKWDRRRIQVMVEVNVDKYTAHPYLCKLLLSTGSKYLEETNDWGDSFWGVCNGKGLNVLGRILMEIRSLIRYKGRDFISEEDIKSITREVQQQISDLSLATKGSNIDD